MIGAALTLGAALLISLYPWRRQQLETSFWVWDSRPRLESYQRDLLANMGVKRLFLKTGAFALHDGRVKYVRELELGRGHGFKGLRVTIVYPAKRSLLTGLQPEEFPTLGETIAEVYEREKQDLEKKGLTVEGVQLDFDFAESRIPLYRHALRSLRRKLHGDELSVTIVPAWFTSVGFFFLLWDVDFTVPMLFATRLPRDPADSEAILDLEGFRKWIRIMRFIPKRSYVGIPAYSQLFVYQADGSLAGMESDVGLQDILRDRRIHLENVTRPGWRAAWGFRERMTGVNAYAFRVVRPTVLKRLRLARNSTLVYHELSTLAARNALSAVRRQPWFSGVAGVVFFRLPRPGSTQVLSLAQVDAAVSGRDDWSRHEVVLERVRREQGRVSFVARLTNLGNAPSLVHPEDNFVQIRLQNGRFAEVDPGDFSRAEFGVGFESEFMNTRPERADSLRLTAVRVPAQASVRSGIVSVSAADPGEIGVFVYSSMTGQSEEEPLVLNDRKGIK